MGENWTGLFNEPDKSGQEGNDPWKNVLQDPPPSEPAKEEREGNTSSPPEVDWGHLLDNSAAIPPSKTLDWSDLTFEDAQSVTQELYPGYFHAQIEPYVPMESIQ